MLLEVDFVNNSYSTVISRELGLRLHTSASGSRTLNSGLTRQKGLDERFNPE